MHESYLKTCSLKITVYFVEETSGQDILQNSFFCHSSDFGTDFSVWFWEHMTSTFLFLRLALGCHRWQRSVDLLWWTWPYQTESTDHRKEMRRLPISPSPPPDPQLQPLSVTISKSTNQQLKSEQKHSTYIMFNVLNKMALFKHKVVRYTRCNSLYCIWRKKKTWMNATLAKSALPPEQIIIMMSIILTELVLDSLQHLLP